MLNTINQWRRQYKLFGLVVLFLILYLIVFNNLHEEKKEGPLVLLEEISNDEIYGVSDEKLIFFIESSREVREGVIRIKPRQACAIESTARIHEQHTIYLLYTSPSHFENNLMYINKTDSIQKELLKYDNLKIRRLNIKKYMINTPLEDWFNKGTLKTSKFPIEHTSDVLRLLTLWKYGGTYFDLDFVIMKNLDAMGSNYLVAETSTDLSNSVLNFRRSAIGHDFAERCLVEVKNSFNGNHWTFNGPQLIYRILNKFCNTTDIRKMNENSCKGIRVLEPWHVYPIGWTNWNDYFDMEKKDKVLEKIESSYAIHLWNKLSKFTIINTQERDVAYGAIARKYCPSVYRKSGRFF